jgi:hypothetical protein
MLLQRGVFPSFLRKYPFDKGGLKGDFFSETNTNETSIYDGSKPVRYVFATLEI